MLSYDLYDTEDDDTDDVDPYPHLRSALDPAYRHLAAEDLEEVLAGAGLSAEDLEFSLRKLVRDVGRVAQQVAPTVLPVAGTIVGTAVGGPLGAAAGGALGQLAGGAIGAAGAPPAARPATRPPAPPRPHPASTPRPAPAARAPVRPAPAAAQLLSLVQRPEFLQGLLTMALGSGGTRQVPVAGTSVPPAAFTNLLSTLAAQAVTEYHEAVAAAESSVAYLLDADGEYVVDPAVPEERAGRLWDLLAASEATTRWSEDDGDEEDADEEDEAVAWDALELSEVLYG